MASGAGSAGGAAAPGATLSSNAPGAGGANSAQNLNNIVIEYLSKKGYTKTEAMLRHESTAMEVDGRTASALYNQYSKTFARLENWVTNSLDLYKPELQKLLWPIFVHLFLTLLRSGSPEATKFREQNSKAFETKHAEDLAGLSAMTLPQHIEDNEAAKIYTDNKYQISLTNTTYQLLMHFLSEFSSVKEGGDVIMNILNTNIQINRLDKPNSFGYIVEEDMLGDDEGLPGHVTGSGKGPEGGLPKLRLGLMPMNKEFISEVEEELEREDARDKEKEGGGAQGPSHLETFQQHIKREESEDTPMRDDIPLPPFRQVEIDSEIRTVKEYRDRYKLSAIALTANTQPGLEGPPLGGALPSALMYTFHNTNDNLQRLAFSKDSSLIAGGFAESYIRIWNLKGEKLVSMNQSENSDVSSSRRYIGHSGPVYGVSFSPDNRWLLSSSEDKSVRLWSLQTHTSLVSFKGHDSPVWDVAWGPFGHYFATASHDNTARMWSSEHIAPLRIFVGHLDAVNRVGWHPNSAYVVTGSYDKTLRMWDIQQGSSVRLFNGHTAPIRCLEVSPNGKYIASGADDGTISIWDIGMSRRIKTMRGHGKAPVWSVSWSMEGSVLVSGGADNTLRVWSVGEDKPPAANSSGTVGAEMVINGIGGLPGDGTAKSDAVAGTAAALGVLGAKGRKDKKEVVATTDHLAAYYTKRTPVYKVQFTRKNLVLAGGAYLP